MSSVTAQFDVLPELSYMFLHELQVNMFLHELNYMFLQELGYMFLHELSCMFYN